MGGKKVDKTHEKVGKKWKDPRKRRHKASTSHSKVWEKAGTSHNKVGKEQRHITHQREGEKSRHTDKTQEEGSGILLTMLATFSSTKPPCGSACWAPNAKAGFVRQSAPHAFAASIPRMRSAFQMSAISLLTRTT